MRKKSFKQPVLLLAAAAVLLLASTVGSTQAALTYYSENYKAQVTVSNIGVTLLENGSEVAYRNYVKTGTDTYGWDHQDGVLLKNMLGEDEKLVLGQEYDEELSVKNSGEIDSYVRVILTKSWKTANGQKATELSPDLIQLKLKENIGWIKADSAEYSPERIVLYYNKVLKTGETTPECTENISISSELAKHFDQQVSADGKTVTYCYTYNGYQFFIEAEVDAVQTHNAADAMKSAWGIDAQIAADGTLSLK